MSELEIMLPTEITETRTSKYPSVDRSMGVGLRSEVSVLGDHSEDETLVKSDKRMCYVSEGEEDDWNDNGDFPENLSNKKRHRRGKTKKRKWKPYYKLSWQERRELEEREAQRALNVREARFAHGQPVAPYNTTQFLMDDHNVQELDLSHLPNGHRNVRESTIGADSSDDFYSSPEDEEEFLQKQFSEAYENVHAERLNAMSKAELVKEYMELEERVDGLEAKLKEKTKLSRTLSDASVVLDLDDLPETEEDEDHRLQSPTTASRTIKRLTEENEKLKLENELLRTMLFPSASP